MTSAYDRTDGNIRNLINNSELLYLDPNKNRTDTWLMQLRVQFPSRQPSYGSIGNISYAEDGVKITGKTLQELGGTINGSASVMNPAPQTGAGSSQRWDNTSDDTAEESRGRELAYTRLQSENAILNETVAQLRKLTDRQNNTIGKLQDKLRLTKTPEARQSDARRQARAYLSEYGSRADMESIAGQLKTVGIKKAATIPFSGVVAADFFELVRQMAFLKCFAEKTKARNPSELRAFLVVAGEGFEPTTSGL